MIVAAAMRIEARAARRALRGTGVEVVWLGMGETRLSIREGAGPVVVAGVCGALVPLAPGTVVVPDEVGGPDGALVRCDPELTARLREAAARRGWPVTRGRLLTASTIVRGPERVRLAARGFETVDMETAPVLRRSPGAVVRVVLDDPDHELPAPAELRDPRRWPDAVRLLWRAPGCVRRAAELAADVANQ